MCKLKFLVIVIALFGADKISAQKIFMYKTFGGVIYLRDDTTELSPKQTSMLLYQNKKAFDQFNKARKWQTISTATGFIGGAMVAIPIATYAFGERADLGFAAGGVALVGTGLIANWIFRGMAIDAIDLYNAELPQKTSRIKPQFEFYGTGARLVIKF